MVRVYKILLIIISLAFCLKLSANDSARVVRVKDGDTYVLRKGNTDFTVRLKNVDSPELKQPYGYLSFVNTQANYYLVGWFLMTVPGKICMVEFLLIFG
jgi:hypothetical protein